MTELIWEGKYDKDGRKCPHCGYEYHEPKEKMTDVNIAVELIKDAYENAYDVALLISADSDLVPPVNTVKQLFPTKRIVVAFPPARSSVALAAAAHAHFQIGRAQIAKSIFPDEVTKADGCILRCPGSWK